MEKPHSTDKHINNLIEFRQAVYQDGFTSLRDAQLEPLDALLLSGPICSFSERWPSAYAAIEDRRQDTD